jgi:hypothetical protein
MEFNKNRFRNKNKNRNRNNRFDNRSLNLEETKSDILSFIYDKLDLAQYKFKFAKQEDDLKQLKDGKYYLSPNYNGINCLLIFVKIKEKFYSCLIDRRSLSYNFNKIIIEDIKFTPVNVRLDMGIYKTTIIDGILLHGTTPNRKKMFMINDMYWFRGENFTYENMTHKMMNIKPYLDKFYKRDNTVNNIEFMVNELYELNKISELTKEIIPNMKILKHIRGITFYPEKSGTKIIYNYDITGYFPKTEEIVEKTNFLKDIKLSNNLNAVFEMRNTDVSDVYELYLLKKMNINGRKVAKSKLYDIAYIPTAECSSFCKKLFDNNKKVLMNCKFYPKRNKWEPTKIAKESKRPDTLSDIKRRVKTL